MPNRYMEKIYCWRSLNSLKDNLEPSTCLIVGDFNTIMQNTETRGGNIVKDPMREHMENLITEWDLFYVKPLKGKYTWTNK